MSENIEPQSGNTEPQYQAGDTVTLSRGKFRGEQAQVIGVDKGKQEYALQTGHGLVIASFAAVKPKQEKVLTESQFKALREQYGFSEEFFDAVLKHFES